MQRTYEVMFIVRPDMGDEDLDRLLSTFEGQVGLRGRHGEECGADGEAGLAYVVRGFQEGIYILFTVESDAAVMVHELERRLRVTEPVIKFITVRVDEQQKRLDKIRKHRELHRDRVRRRRPKRNRPPLAPSLRLPRFKGLD